MEERITNVAYEYDAITKSSVNDLPVGRDLARLANYFRLFEKRSGKYSIDQSQSIYEIPLVKKEQKETIVNLLNHFHQLLNEDASIRLDEKMEQKIRQEEFDEKVNMKDHTTLTSFLVEKFGDNKINAILKLCNQAIVVSFLGHVGEILAFNAQIRCKDVRGSWYIHIVRNVDESDRSPFISVIHVREEQALRLVNTMWLRDLFKFKWQIEIAFDKDMSNLYSIEAKLLNVDWSALDPELKLSDEEKKNIEEQFRKLFGHPKLENLKTHLEQNPIATVKEKNKSAKIVEKEKQKHKGSIFINFLTSGTSEDTDDVWEFVQKHIKKK